MVAAALPQPGPDVWPAAQPWPEAPVDALPPFLPAVPPAPDSLAVLVVPERVDAEQVNQVLAGFETVVLTHDARSAAAALSALAGPDPAIDPASPAAGRAPSASGELVLDPDHHEATWRGRSLALTAHERVMLHSLLSRPRQVWTYQRLHEDVWRGAYLGDPAMVHSAVKRLRHKLTLAGVPHRIVTVRGIGFRLDDAIS
ncbi:MAG: winged helix-turn-helix domain-containing protein [Jatrophihabitans sp.]